MRERSKALHDSIDTRAFLAVKGQKHRREGRRERCGSRGGHLGAAAGALRGRSPRRGLGGEDEGAAQGRATAPEAGLEDARHRCLGLGRLTLLSKTSRT